MTVVKAGLEVDADSMFVTSNVSRLGNFLSMVAAETPWICLS